MWNSIRSLLLTYTHTQSFIDNNFLLGGAGVCQKPGLLLPAEQQPLPADLWSHPGTRNRSYRLSYPESSAAYPQLTNTHLRFGVAMGRFVWLQLCVFCARRRRGSGECLRALRVLLWRAWRMRFEGGCVREKRATETGSTTTGAQEEWPQSQTRILSKNCIIECNIFTGNISNLCSTETKKCV